MDKEGGGVSYWDVPGCVAQFVLCLATDARLTADPGVASSIPARSHTFLENDHEIFFTVILLPSADSFKKGCQLQAKVCARITGYPLVQACPGKSVFRWTDRPAMTIAVDFGRKANKQNHWDGSFEYPEHITWMRNKENKFPIHTLIWWSTSMYFTEGRIDLPREAIASWWWLYQYF